MKYIKNIFLVIPATLFLQVGSYNNNAEIKRAEETVIVKLKSPQYQYYKSINNTSRETSLVSTLSQLISKTHSNHLTYKKLWEVFEYSDLDQFYNNDNKIIDIYSYSFKKQPLYKYNFKKNQCGGKGYKKEGDCYNREHLVPQSWFKKKMPMVADAHHIFPTDGWVNNLRSNYDIAEVKTVKTITSNGSKSGTDENNQKVFEPIDEFKGNIARAYLYFAINYHNTIKQNKWKLFTGTYPFIEKRLATYLQWHEKDPVDAYDIHRNENIFNFQKNRNPFVDIPVLAKLIWNQNFANTKIKLIEARN